VRIQRCVPVHQVLHRDPVEQCLRLIRVAGLEVPSDLRRPNEGIHRRHSIKQLPCRLHVAGGYVAMHNHRPRDDGPHPRRRRLKPLPGLHHVAPLRQPPGQRRPGDGRPGGHTVEQRQRLAHVARGRVPGEQSIAGDDVPLRQFVEHPARVGEGASLAVHGHQCGADEQVAGGGGLDGLRMEGPAET
jgi:hypothetical protein